jgi:hypothetical protein
MCTKPTNDVSIEKDVEVSIPVSNTVINLGDDTNEEEDSAGSKGKRKTVSGPDRVVKTGHILQVHPTYFTQHRPPEAKARY